MIGGRLPNGELDGSDGKSKSWRILAIIAARVVAVALVVAGDEDEVDKYNEFVIMDGLTCWL